MNFDPYIHACFVIEWLLPCPHAGTQNVHVSLHHDLAGKAAEECFHPIVPHII